MRSTTTRSIDDWLASFPAEDGFAHVSAPRRYAHDEAKYDAQYASDPANLVVGRGLITLLGRTGADFSGPALEIGCGTGLVSLGLAAEDAYPLALLTDPSPEFLRITRDKVRAHGFDEGRVRWGVLTAEEIDRLPAGMFSLIVLRSTLHHVANVERFLRDASRALAPGGVLTFQEPCQEGYVLMGALAQFLPLCAERAGRALTPEQQGHVTRFVNSMKFYSRRDVDKSRAEDKHLFRVDELMRWGASCGLGVEFLPNMAYEYYSFPEVNRPGPDAFTPFFRGYARYCMSWDEGLMRLFDELLTPYCAYIEDIKGPGGPPYLHGVFLCRKAALPVGSGSAPS
jgi:ubiquinone/menaquinone biosynthesis C-methylase UbiE